MKVGDYVRTKDGTITKIIDSRKNPYGEETIFILDKEISIYDLELSDMYLMTNPFAEDTTNEIDTHFGDEKTIKKSDSKLIKLVQVGDYVNGHLVYKTKENCVLVGYKCFKTEFDNEEDYLNQTIYEENIKSIVTKEQFESIEYKVG